MAHGTASRARGSRSRMRRRAFLLDAGRDTGRDENDVVKLVEKPDKMSPRASVGPGLRVPGQPIRDVGRRVEVACVS